MNRSAPDGSPSPHRVRATVGILAVGVIAWPAGGWADKCRDRTPTTWDITIAPANEPGEPFVLTGLAINAADRKPLANVIVYVYHADSRGLYNAINDEFGEPRLCGVLKTNADGAFRVRSKLPGGYGGYPGHVHFEYWGRGISRQHAFVNLHADKKSSDKLPPAPRTTKDLWKYTPAARVDRSSIERPVVRGADGVWTAERDLIVH
jgi:hypothetical protein